MFRKILESWRLKGRMNDVEERLDHLERQLKASRVACEERSEFVEASIAKVRGRLTGGQRNNGEPTESKAEEIDRLIREGRYPG